jgi:very-short-patch-repair endonuclease
MEWHANPTAWKRDRIKNSRLQECGWDLVRFVVDDVRRYPVELVRQVSSRIDAARLAS